MRKTDVSVGFLVCLLLVCAAEGGAEPSSLPLVQADAQSQLPDTRGVFIVLRDMEIAYERVEIHTIVPNELGASALVGLPRGTLVDVWLVEVAEGWTLRDIFYVAGDADEYRAWVMPWRRRVEEAERFLASTGDEGQERRRAEELAPLVWFEDVEESSRLWGLNPVTYRLMESLRMLPAGPMDGSGTGPRGRQ